MKGKNQHKYKRRKVDTSYQPSELHPKTKNNIYEDKHGVVPSKHGVVPHLRFQQEKDK
ncbi:hypothetical protein Hanom_Chr11g01029211 [Helianthus anomalus]